MTMLARLSGVSKTFANGTLALRSLDLNIGDGEFLTLLGPSGCGKSTALRLLAGLMPPSEGTVSWKAGATPEIGFVFQEPTLMPWASVFDNVWLPLRLRNQSRKTATKEIEQALALVGLGDVAHVYPRELSGGMKMLDEITRFKLNNDLLRLKTELGTTVVFVTHSVFESVYLSSRIAVFSARPGRVIAEIDIPEPLPRDENFRLSPAYAEHCRVVSQALQRAMTDQAA